MNRVVFESGSVDWSTPHQVYASLYCEFQFNLDPCPLGGGMQRVVTEVMEGPQSVL